MSFGISGALAGLTGVLLLGFTGSAYGDVGTPYLFLSIAAVVVGGTSAVGGAGGYGSSLVGAIILTELATILVGFGLTTAAQQAVTGLVLLLLVAFYGREVPVSYRV